MPSRVIRAYEYDALKRELIVTFVTGRRYAYEGVPNEVFAWLSSARSKGVYFNRFIRDAYAFRELPPE
jgi:hypothetical protein